MIKTPFDEEQIKQLNEIQQTGIFHPYTCDRHAKGCEVNQKPRDYRKEGILKATKEGWVCPCGKYKQNWA